MGIWLANDVCSVCGPTVSVEDGKMRSVTEYFSLIAQVAATLLVAYVVLVGPRRNPDRVARITEVIGSALMAFVLVGAMAFALPTADHSKETETSGWMLLAMIMSVLAMIFSAFGRPVRADKPFWFRPADPIDSHLRPRRTRSVARPMGTRSRHRR